MAKLSKFLKKLKEDQKALLAESVQYGQGEPSFIPYEAPQKYTDPFQPSFSQAVFYNCETPNQYFKGGVGAGKTTIMVRKAIKIALQYPGIKILMTRLTGPALESTTLQDFERICPPEYIIESRVKPWIQKRFYNGSVVRFKAYEESDLDKLGSEFYGCIILEEANEFSENAWDRFNERLRQDKGVGIDPDGHEYETDIPKQFLIAIANPGGRNWLWRLFSRDNPDAKEFTVNDDGSVTYKNPDYFFITCPTTENLAHLPPAYWKRLQKLPKHKFQRMVMGDDSPYEGLVFPEFRRELNIVPSFKGVPPTHWPVYFGMDVGRRSPTTCDLIAVTEEGCYVVFKEYGATMRTPQANAKAILTLFGTLIAKGMPIPKLGFIDPSSAHHKGESDMSLSVFQQLVRAGLNTLKPASKDQDGRIMRLSSLLEVDPDLKNHPVTGQFREEGWPRLYFTEECHETIREFEEWEFSKTTNPQKDAPEKPEERNDHYIDATGYAIAEIYDFAPLNFISRDLWENSEAYANAQAKKKYLATWSQEREWDSGARSPLNDGMT